MISPFLLSLGIFLSPSPTTMENGLSFETVESRHELPEGYSRTSYSPRSFATWLRSLPLKGKGHPVLLHTGKPKHNQSAHESVIDISVGKKDLQQCADAWIRLRAEFLRQSGQLDKIAFHFTSGDLFKYQDWLDGLTPQVRANNVTWIKKGKRADDNQSFHDYLELVFLYAGSYSLDKALASKPSSSVEPGDVFLEGGFPGHAVIVMDVAEHQETGQKIFLLAQSFMPAQEIHILKNPTSEMSPWYSVPQGRLLTPEWQFEANRLKSFR